MEKAKHSKYYNKIINKKNNLPIPYWTLSLLVIALYSSIIIRDDFLFWNIFVISLFGCIVKLV